MGSIGKAQHKYHGKTAGENSNNTMSVLVMDNEKVTTDGLPLRKQVVMIDIYAVANANAASDLAT